MDTEQYFRVCANISLDAIRDNIKKGNLHITGIPKGEEREKGIENIFEEIMAESFPTLKKETDIQNRKHRGSQTDHKT